MQQDRPSLTAWRVALRRAAHQLLDRPLVLDDPVAIPIVSAAAVEEALATHDKGSFLWQRYARAFRAIIVARSRFAEDHLAAAVSQGDMGQYVVLGAGLDTFAHRNPYPHMRVFEVDHPATQIWKRELLAAAKISAPANLAFVPIDFDTHAATLGASLGAAGFDPGRSAFFSCLGVVPYLTLAAFRQTLAYLATLGQATQIAFDYASDPQALGMAERFAFDMLARHVKAAGEPFQLFLDPPDMRRELAAAGFTRIEDLDAAGINGRYFRDRADQLRVAGKIAHLLHATR